MTTSTGKNGPRTVWTESMIEILLDRYANDQTSDIAEQLGLTIQKVYTKASKLGLKKSAEFLTSYKSGRADGKRGHSTRFRPGQTVWNKGKKIGSKGRMVETQFKKGLVPANVLPVGHIRINTDGYKDIKVAPGPRNWVQLHRYNWKQVHGEYPPKGMTLVFRDGNKLNCEPENLELISRQDLMKRNSFHKYGPEIASLVQLRGALTRQINKKEKNNE